jgi:hypothetical protein
VYHIYNGANIKSAVNKYGVEVVISQQPYPRATSCQFILIILCWSMPANISVEVPSLLGLGLYQHVVQITAKKANLTFFVFLYQLSSISFVFGLKRRFVRCRSELANHPGSAANVKHDSQESQGSSATHHTCGNRKALKSSLASVLKFDPRDEIRGPRVGLAGVLYRNRGRKTRDGKYLKKPQEHSQDDTNTTGITTVSPRKRDGSKKKKPD